MSNLHKFRGTLIRGGKKWSISRFTRAERSASEGLARRRQGRNTFRGSSASSRIPARAASVGESAAIISSDGGIPERRRRRRRRRVKTYRHARVPFRNSDSRRRLLFVRGDDRDAQFNLLRRGENVTSNRDEPLRSRVYASRRCEP